MGKLSNYNQDVRQAISYAREEAQRLRHRWVGPEHLLLGILRLKAPLIDGLFACLHVSTDSIVQALVFVVGRGNKAILSEPALNPVARAALMRAEDVAQEPDALISIEHLFLAILEERDSVVMGVLESFGIYLEAAHNQLVLLANGGYERLLLSTHYYTCYDATPLLNQVSRDLTLAALDGAIDPMIGREAELERTMQILSRRTKNNPVLLGPAGVGKTAIAEGLALRIVEGRVPNNLAHVRIVALDASLLAVGTKFRGDLEERLKRILHEIITTPGIIVFIDELHTLAQAGVAEGSIDTANLFKPILARGEFRCIGSTTFDEYRKSIEADPALERRFQPVFVAETNAQETLAILQGLRSRYEAYHHVSISDEVLLAAVKMSSQYIQQRFQPDKALDLLDEAAARVCVQGSSIPDHVRLLREEMIIVQREKDNAITHRNFPQAALLLRRERRIRQELWQAETRWQTEHSEYCPVVDVQDIAKIVAMWTGIPVVEITGEERHRLLHLEDELHRRVIGQHKAVQAVAKAVRRSRAQIGISHRPIGSFIFVGPTGVGKTELARALAEALFGDEKALFKLDMSEFMESHHTTRLIGAPRGYVGYDQAGQLTEAVRRRPYSVLLFDEIEKAHPKVCDLLLQILEDGRLTDTHGMIVDFKHTVVILSSNIGTEQWPKKSMLFAPNHIKETHAYLREAMCEQILHSLRATFSPEFLNRIDETIVFHPLEEEHLYKIVDLLILQTQKRLAALSITLFVTEAVRLFLVEQGYDIEYGARPLRRTVQRLLEDMLAENILQRTLSPGDAVIVDAINNTLYIQKNVYLTHTADPVTITIDASGHVAA